MKSTIYLLLRIPLLKKMLLRLYLIIAWCVLGSTIFTAEAYSLRRSASFIDIRLSRLPTPSSTIFKYELSDLFQEVACIVEHSFV